MLVAVLCAAVSQPPSAVADSVASLRDALASARSGASCGPLRSDPIVEQVAEKINQANEDWMNHAATQVPATDPLPGLKILGYGGSNAKLLQGAGRTGANAIKGALLEGYDKIPVCSYTDYGASLRRNDRTGWYLAVAVLAGA
jgi:hypothetical protein